MRVRAWGFAELIQLSFIVPALVSIAGLTGCSSSSSGVVTQPISVTITNKITTIGAGTAAVTLNASVQNDSTNSGVTWTMIAGGSACSPGCGSLSATTANSVMYTPPATVPASPNNVPTISATSTKDTSKSASDSFTVIALTVTVTITDRIKTVQIGTAPITLHATVQNDSTNTGVVWSDLSDSGGACSPACGTLSNKTATSVIYTPPGSVPSAPANVPDITASSAHDPSAFQDDTFDIISGAVSSCAGTPTGHESRLSGQYAFFAEGFGGTGASLAGSFAPDGTGKITDLGGGVGGQVDLNTGDTPATATILPAGSLYTVGADPTGAGDIGCLQTLTSDGNTTIYRFSLAAPTGAVATKGRIIEYDDQSGSNRGQRVSGVILKQDPTAFSSGDTSHLQANYVFGVSGIGAGAGVAAAGSFVLAPASGAIAKMTFDEDIGGLAQPLNTASTATITNVSPTTGRALFQFTATTSTFAPTGIALYIVNANEILLTSVEPQTIGFPGLTPASRYSGRAIVSAATSQSPAGNFILHATGLATCGFSKCSAVALGSLTLTSTTSTTGTTTGTLVTYSVPQGVISSNLTGGTYSADAATGRVTVSPSGLTPLPVAYLAAPVATTESIQAFLIGTDAGVAFGLLEPGAPGNVTVSSLAGNYFFSDEQARDETVVSRVGAAKISGTGVTTGTEEDSATAGLSTKAVNYTVTIDNTDGPATGNIGANTFAITNGTKLFFVDENTGLPASITAVERQ